jgi:hypothetical protein
MGIGVFQDAQHWYSHIRSFLIRLLQWSQQSLEIFRDRGSDGNRVDTPKISESVFHQLYVGRNHRSRADLDEWTIGLR